jgi:putative transposase
MQFGARCTNKKLRTTLKGLKCCKELYIMSTYTQIIYQIVFSTKHRENSLKGSDRNDLYKYISGILKNKGCHLYQIGGVSDHIHIITHLHPSVALSNLVKDIKLASSKYIKSQNMFPQFTSWQEGYGAFTYSKESLDNLISYVQNQETHHKKVLYIDELKEFLKQHNVEYDKKYLV